MKSLILPIIAAAGFVAVALLLNGCYQTTSNPNLETHTTLANDSTDWMSWFPDFIDQLAHDINESPTYRAEVVSHTVFMNARHKYLVKATIQMEHIEPNDIRAIEGITQNVMKGFGVSATQLTLCIRQSDGSIEQHTCFVQSDEIPWDGIAIEK